MLLFPIAHLMDEEKCYDFLVDLLHPEGLRCPTCQTPVQETTVHRRARAPLLFYRCPCGRIFNAWAETLLQGTHWSAVTWVQVLRGFAQGVSTKHLAEELGLARPNLLNLRHKCQAVLLSFSPDGAAVGFGDRGGRNVPERRRKGTETPRPGRPAAPARKQGARSRHMGHGSPPSIRGSRARIRRDSTEGGYQQSPDRP